MVKNCKKRNQSVEVQMGINYQLQLQRFLEIGRPIDISRELHKQGPLEFLPKLSKYLNEQRSFQQEMLQGFKLMLSDLYSQCFEKQLFSRKQLRSILALITSLTHVLHQSEILNLEQPSRLERFEQFMEKRSSSQQSRARSKSKFESEQKSSSENTLRRDSSSINSIDKKRVHFDDSIGISSKSKSISKGKACKKKRTRRGRGKKHKFREQGKKLEEPKSRINFEQIKSDYDKIFQDSQLTEVKYNPEDNLLIENSNLTLSENSNSNTVQLDSNHLTQIEQLDEMLFYFLRETYFNYYHMIRHDLEQILKNRVQRFKIEIWESNNYLFNVGKLMIYERTCSIDEIRQAFSQSSNVSCSTGNSLATKQFNSHIKILDNTVPTLMICNFQF
ncbi:UNKNOWN [Stylonychia lemnae]|uniref:Uncharacterized protein n=1 Tax=Stylonychia lemnae TaxID=5949 RepID=A0A078ARL3_STYLE|nr:UNKNOWN [Stylonychia lemnae]|eukprot:CDW84844.1 UNKNOWN [Stylonychia lemnae]